MVRAIRRKKQGLGGLELVVSDGHKGIRSAVEKAFGGRYAKVHTRTGGRRFKKSGILIES